MKSLPYVVKACQERGIVLDVVEGALDMDYPEDQMEFVERCVLPVESLMLVYLLSEKRPCPVCGKPVVTWRKVRAFNGLPLWGCSNEKCGWVGWFS